MLIVPRRGGYKTYGFQFWADDTMDMNEKIPSIYATNISLSTNTTLVSNISIGNTVVNTIPKK